MDNIQYAYRTRDGELHPINVAGCHNVTDAVFEVVSSILNGDLDITVDDIVEYRDIPG